MKMVKLDTGYTNPPAIDLDRVMYFIHYAVPSEQIKPNIGVEAIRFVMFGSDRHLEVFFRSEERALDCYNNLIKHFNIDQTL